MRRRQIRPRLSACRRKPSVWAPAHLFLKLKKHDSAVLISHGSNADCFLASAQQKNGTNNVLVFVRAEAVRFELTVPCGTPVFKTGALNHYATPPFYLIFTITVAWYIRRLLDIELIQYTYFAFFLKLKHKIPQSVGILEFVVYSALGASISTLGVSALTGFLT